MGLVQTLLIAVGLAMDAFAVSVSAGLRVAGDSRRHMARIALHFGAFQAVMPVIGWLAGRSLRAAIAAYDHWVAFGLLALIGAKMVVEGIRPGAPDEAPCGPLQHGELLVLSVATSIDALAVGVSLAMLEVRVWRPALVIGVVTGLLSAAGIETGDRVGSRVGHRAELLGGLVLCGLGVKILVEHLT